jgi:DNA polymerase
MEDRLGRPFVGQAGKLLDFVLAKLSLSREDLWITNVLRCRPPENKLPPAADLEVCVDACWPYLEAELQAVDPKVVLLLGGGPVKMLGIKGMITRLEGMEVEEVYEGARTFCALHPAYVLRAPSKEANLGRAIWRAARCAGLKPKALGEEVGLFDYEVRGV